MYTEKVFIALADGNYGALNFLMELSACRDVPIKTVEKILLSGITGSDLWILYSDLCNKDLPTVVKLVDNCPLEILKDACSREDYSGQKLVEEYLK